MTDRQSTTQENQGIAPDAASCMAMFEKIMGQQGRRYDCAELISWISGQTGRFSCAEMMTVCCGVQGEPDETAAAETARKA